MIEDAKGAAEADVALLDSVLAFLLAHRDVAIEFCAYLLINMGSHGDEREKAIFGLKGIVCSAMCDADAELDVMRTN
jgi:hypothetical protein